MPLADVISQVVLPLVLATIMFTMGLKVKMSHFKQVLTKPKVTLIGLLLQLLLLPCLALAIINVCQLNPTASISLFLVSLCPGGATSNLFTYLVKGDIALSVTLTAITSMLIPVSLPLLLNAYANYIGHDLENFFIPLAVLIKQLIAVSLMPIFLGMITRHYFPKFALFLAKRTKKAATIMMLLVVIALLSTHSSTTQQLLTINGIAVMLLCCSAFMLSYFMTSWLSFSNQQIKTLSIEVGVQNAGTAMMVALALLNQPSLAVIPLMYGLFMNFPALAFVWWQVKRK